MQVTSQPRHYAGWSPIGRTHRQQDYYVVREASGDYTGYWGKVKDPDGHERDRMSESERLLWLENVAEELSFVQSLPPGVIVDYGAGPGWLLRELPEWDRLAIEVAPQAQAAIAEAGIPQAADLWGVADATVDVIVCYHVIEHLRAPIDALCEMRRVMKPGGWLVLGTPDFDSPCAQRFGDNYRMLHDPTHCSLFTRESMQRFLTDHGFDVHDVRYPFPERFNSPETFARWSDTDGVSPPWPGNWMTFYATRSNPQISTEARNAH